MMSLHFAPPFFKDIPSSFITLARTAFPWNSTVDLPKFTGIPPHVTLLVQMEIMQEELRELKRSINENINDELNHCGIGSNQFNTQRLEDMISNLNDNVMKQMEQHREETMVNWRVLQEREERDIPYDLLDEEMEEGEELDVGVGMEGDSVGVQYPRVPPAMHQVETTNTNSNDGRGRRKKRKIIPYLVKGKLSLLPRDFVFPKMTCQQLVHNWFIPNNALKIVSYRRLSFNDVQHVPNGKDTRQKMGRFMAVVEKYARMENCWFNEWDAAKVTTMWNAVGNKHIYMKYANVSDSRLFTGTWFTMLRKMKNKGAFKKNQASCGNDEQWALSIHNDSIN